MSEVERNKGRLVPVTEEEVLKAFPDLLDCDDLAFDTGYNVFRIRGQFYWVEWEVKRETDTPSFADVSTNEDGSIDFHTMHYNGGGSVDEVIERSLRDE